MRPNEPHRRTFGTPFATEEEIQVRGSSEENENAFVVFDVFGSGIGCRFVRFRRDSSRRGEHRQSALRGFSGDVLD